MNTFFVFIFFSQLLIASEKNERDNIKRTLVEYLQTIDEKKNASGFSQNTFIFLTEEVGTEGLFSVLGKA